MLLLLYFVYICAGGLCHVNILICSTIIMWINLNMLTYKVGNCNNWIKKNLICTSTLNTIVFSMDIFSNRISIILVFAWSNEQRKDISSWKEILFAKKLSFSLLHFEIIYTWKSRFMHQWAQTLMRIFTRL